MGWGCSVGAGTCQFVEIRPEFVVSVCVSLHVAECFGMNMQLPCQSESRVRVAATHVFGSTYLPSTQPRESRPPPGPVSCASCCRPHMSCLQTSLPQETLPDMPCANATPQHNGQQSSPQRDATRGVEPTCGLTTRGLLGGATSRVGEATRRWANSACVGVSLTTFAVSLSTACLACA